MGKADRRPVAVDLFSGAGGLGLGFEQAGFDIAAALEYDPIHAAVHAYNFPLTKMVCADATKAKGADLMDAVRDGLMSHGVRGWDGRIDCVIGGPPCQGYSWAGHRRVDDERNGLIFEFMRLVRELRPRAFVMENVPGILSGGHRALIERFVKRLRDFGWQVVSPIRCLNASDFGVPQDRERVFLLGAAWGETLPAYPDPTCNPVAKRPGMKRQVRENLPDGPDVMAAIGDLPDADDFEALLESDEALLEPLVRAAACACSAPYALRMRAPTNDPDDLSRRRPPSDMRLTSSNRTTHEPKCVARFEATKEGEVEAVSRFYRLHRSGLSCTLRAGTGRERGAFNAPRPIHPVHHRVLTVREAARLHSFPDWFRLNVTKWHGFRQVGNSVPPLLARAVAKEVVKALGARPSRPDGEAAFGDPSLLALNMTEAAARMGADPETIPGARRRGT